jgi:hypothetical protein
VAACFSVTVGALLLKEPPIAAVQVGHTHGACAATDCYPALLLLLRMRTVGHCCELRLLLVFGLT